MLLARFYSDDPILCKDSILIVIIEDFAVKSAERSSFDWIHINNQRLNHQFYSIESD